MPPPAAVGLLGRYVELHNRRDWRAVASLFSDDGVLRFEGIPLAPCVGPIAIEGAFRDHPPEDELVLGGITVDGARGEAPYAWRSAPARNAGVLVIVVAGSLIRELLIRRSS